MTMQGGLSESVTQDILASSFYLPRSTSQIHLGKVWIDIQWRVKIRSHYRHVRKMARPEDTFPPFKNPCTLQLFAHSDNSKGDGIPNTQAEMIPPTPEHQARVQRTQNKRSSPLLCQDLFIVQKKNGDVRASLDQQQDKEKEVQNGNPQVYCIVHSEGRLYCISRSLRGLFAYPNSRIPLGIPALII